MAHVPAVRRQSIRVALAATGVVAVAYLLIAATVVALSTRDLTSQIDSRLTGAFGRVPPNAQFPGGDGQNGGTGGTGGPTFNPGRDPGRPLDAPVLIWRVAGGTATPLDSNTPALPASLIAVVGPQGATIDGNDVRIAGRQVGSAYVVVAQSTAQIADTQKTIVFGVLLIAPFLLGAVFVGAVIVGRRVAEPIEEARRRQLEFTADASHELRTPLSVIEAHTSLALAQDRDAAWYRTAFTKVERESRRMRHLLEDMLWLARFDAAAEPAPPGPIDLGVLVVQAADRFSAVAETRRLRLAVHPPSEPVVISASAELVDRLVGVLLDNACKYSPDDGAVDVTVGVEAGRAFMAIDDSGPGIPEEDRARVFDRFHRSVSTAAQSGGAGLGLAIGDAIVRATGGRWGIGTSPAGGARFTVSWGRTSAG
ncbi:MAG TPA: HAMP domain-containing sensor histidine kinase [Candidatus Limnocylindrales bacterium]